MSEPMLRIAENFWNIRGSYRVGGVIDVGTQASLVRRNNGKFVFLDAYTLSSSVRRAVNELTEGGEELEAIFNLHPFHTLHVQKMHEMFPGADLYGTARHLERFPELPWKKTKTEDPAFHKRFADDFEFSVPRGVDFISRNEKVHFSSVMAFHRDTRTLHVDDTLVYLRLPSLMRFFGLGDAVSFHPTLAQALERRADAAEDFRDWAEEMIERWRHAENLCAAHTAVLQVSETDKDSIHARMLKALDKVEKTLAAHQQKFG